MMEVSPKGTVPVLVLPDGQVLDESLDIMRWAFRETKNHWTESLEAQMALIHHCDTGFKPWLDRYKYHVRYLEHDRDYYRMKGELFLQGLEDRLQEQSGLFGEDDTLGDLAIMPFVRQFMFVDQKWFDAAPYPELRRWLTRWLDSVLFGQIMKKREPWVLGDEVLVIGDQF